MTKWAKYIVTKRHITGILEGIDIIEYTNVLFELGKVYTSITNTQYIITKIVEL